MTVLTVRHPGEPDDTGEKPFDGFDGEASAPSQNEAGPFDGFDGAGPIESSTRTDGFAQPIVNKKVILTSSPRPRVRAREGGCRRSRTSLTVKTVERVEGEFLTDPAEEVYLRQMADVRRRYGLECTTSTGPASHEDLEVARERYGCPSTHAAWCAATGYQEPQVEEQHQEQHQEHVQVAEPLPERQGMTVGESWRATGREPIRHPTLVESLAATHRRGDRA